MIYLNGAFKTNVSKDVKHYNATGLTPDTGYTISTHTVDTSGNVNETWVNETAKTQEVSWWNSAWSYRRAITLQGSETDLTDFPYYIYLTDMSNMKEEGADLRFLDNLTELNYEIERFEDHDGYWWVLADIARSAEWLNMSYEVVGNQPGKVTIGAEENQGEGEDTYIPPEQTSSAVRILAGTTGLIMQATIRPVTVWARPYSRTTPA